MKSGVAELLHDIPEAPRKIDPARTFDAIVQWIYSQCVAERAPGLIMGISGTDSILTYLACAKAFERLAKPHRVLGVHFTTEAEKNNSWVVQEVFPWLKKMAPQALLEIDSADSGHDDQIRWGKLFSRAVSDTNNRDSLASNYYFPVGTRNATEEHLGTYSQLSGAVSMMPIVNILKSEVLDICAWLGVPDIAMRKSCEVDCDCGRFDVAADYLREVDLWVMHRMGILSRGYLERNMPADVRNAVMEYVIEEETRNQFRRRTPYKPSENLVVLNG
ncbi:MAG: hypothetical protein EPN97_07370 [Alphaproteobacteria bacterium]|nr:MAG: hypothetical protein EPN97_07370 [Alphaproteobacteria bacterium]